jgi:site-specific recombinase XerD
MSQDGTEAGSGEDRDEEAPVEPDEWAVWEDAIRRAKFRGARPSDPARLRRFGDWLWAEVEAGAAAAGPLTVTAELHARFRVYLEQAGFVAQTIHDHASALRRCYDELYELTLVSPRVAMAARRIPAALTFVDVTDDVDEFLRTKDSKSGLYAGGLGHYVRWLIANDASGEKRGGRVSLRTSTPEQARAWSEQLAEELEPGSAAHHRRAMRHYFRWLCDEGAMSAERAGRLITALRYAKRGNRSARSE